MNNVSDTKITNESTNNYRITPLTNRCYGRLTKHQPLFLERATSINKIDGHPFCFRDFEPMTPNNFRQCIHKLKDYIEVVTPGIPTFYRVKGVELPGDSHRITSVDTGVGLNFANLLKQLHIAQPAIHDIKIKIDSGLTHEGLVKRGFTVDKSNKSIKLPIPNFKSGIRIKILIYPRITQIDLACSRIPLVYNIAGLLELLEYLSTVSNYLFLKAGVSLPKVHTWVITHYHFNRDAVSMDGACAHFTFEEVSAGLIRLYTKSINNDGSAVVRAEQIQSPQRSIAEELQEVLKH